MLIIVDKIVELERKRLKTVFRRLKSLLESSSWELRLSVSFHPDPVNIFLSKFSIENLVG